MATIDERLQFLLQSTESLHSSVSELASAQLKNEGNLAELQRLVKAIAQSQLDHADAIARLALIADSHENRLSDLEEGGE